MNNSKDFLSDTLTNSSIQNRYFFEAKQTKNLKSCDEIIFSSQTLEPFDFNNLNNFNNRPSTNYKCKSNNVEERNQREVFGN
jgi:hypothetical protein